MSALVATLVAAAVALLVPGRTLTRGLDREPPFQARAVVVPATAVAGTAFWFLEPRTLALVGIAVGAAAGTGALLAETRARARAEQRADSLVEACEALVAELRAGRPPAHALARAVDPWPELEPVAAAERLGADVPAAMRRLAELPGADGMRHLAAAWQVCSASGAGLAGAFEQVLATTRARRSTERLVQTELASARATGRLVAGLPVAALAAAQGMGAQPWHFLLQTVPGLCCLGAGLALVLAGLWWVERIATTVTREAL